MATRHTLSPALRRAVAANRKRILTREAVIAGMIASAYTSARSQIQPSQAALISAYTRELDALQSDEEDDEESSGPPPTVPMVWATQSGQLPRLNRTVLLSLAAFALAARMHITDGQRQAALQGAQDAQALIRTALEPLTAHLSMQVIDGLVKGAPQGVLDAFVGKSLTTGNPLSTLLDRLGEPTAQRVTKTLYAALSSGMHPTQAARLLTDATGMAYRLALTISRTEMIGAYRSASLAQFRASSDVLDGWIWVAAADACDFCQSMNGTFHTLDETLDSHPNCRCASSPHTKPLADILSLFAA